MGLIYAIILIGVLVFVHELGHFLVAKYFNVKVLQFAIGFGPNLVSYQYGETEYCIKMLPLGGHVLMLGSALDEIDTLPPEDRARTLMAKPIWQRVLVTLAGPAANLIFPILVYFFITLGVTTAQPSVIGEVFENLPASNAGMQAGDKVIGINGKDVRYWRQFSDSIATHPNETLDLVVLRSGKEHTLRVTPQETFQTDSLGLSHRTYGQIGVSYVTYGPTIAVPQPNTLPEQLGLKTFDRIVGVNDIAIDRYDEIATQIQNTKPDKNIVLSVLRPIPVPVSWGHVERFDIKTINLNHQDHETFLQQIESAQMYISRIEPNSPAQASGLQTGDKILAVDGQPFRSWIRLISHLTNETNARIAADSKEGKDPEALKIRKQIKIQRGNQTLTLPFVPKVRKLEKHEAYRVIFGFESAMDYHDPEPIDYPLSDRIPGAFFEAFSETWRVITVTASGIWGMLTGRFGLDNLGGPIMIGNLAAKAGDAGIKPFLQMMSLISVNLGLMNLLPIPMLDGGHLMIYLVEGIQRRPISFRMRQIISYIGIVSIVILLVLAFKNDIERSWDEIVMMIEN